jgi:TRAP-type C4-dicarboxylate transport system permease large subunit
MLLGLSENRIVILVLINLMCLVLGAIMDMGPLLLILTPILMPVVVTKLGMDPVQFGVMLVFNLAIGLCTPPVGTALFAGCSIGKVKIEKASIACIPFYCSMIAALLLITFWPALSLTAPNLVMGK